MNSGADELARDVARQLRVGVERDYVTNVFQQRIVGGAHKEARVVCAPQQSVELLELAAFAFPTHPAILARVPLSPAMEEMKAIVAMPAIERVDAALRDREQIRISWRVFCAGVGKVAEQREVNVIVVIGEIVNFEVLDQFLNLRFVEKDGWDDDERRC